ncbi:GAF and ANTAR domain-containing protein [Microlunatus antarcticus]|uniref:GAF domain-containing protein n=1 Tax=Microlunatus antarcticus TaxID=53388 RepID=A0A7W5JRY0_9ACTN|nr:GAF domain-containing protein [Microlunatus antarcticus]
MTVPDPQPGHHLPIERLQNLLLDVADIKLFLKELAELSTTVLKAPVSSGIMLRYDDTLLTFGFSDARAETLDETQYRVGSGPCLESLSRGQVVSVVDARTEQRWPDYVGLAAETGLRCSLSLPLTIRSDTFGALNLYGFSEPGLFGPTEQRDLELFATQAAGTLRVATRQVKDANLLAQMEESLRSRTVIDQALGIIMGQQRCTATVAFELLRRESQNGHRRLRDVAADLVQRTSGQSPEEGRPFDPS